MHVSELDASKFSFHSLFPGFKNNNRIEGSFVINGSYDPGVNARTFSSTLSVQPDLSDIMYKSGSIEIGAPYASGTPIVVSNKWVQRGLVAVPASGGLGTLYFVISPELSGNTLTFRCYGINNTALSGSLTDATVSWRIIDYSVF